jgi:hypothetical protein
MPDSDRPRMLAKVQIPTGMGVGNRRRENQVCRYPTTKGSCGKLSSNRLISAVCANIPSRP